MDARQLARERFLHLAAVLTVEKKSQNLAAEAMGLDTTYIGKVRDDPKRSIGLQAIAKVTRKLRLSRRFFDDVSLGPTPDYTKLVDLPDNETMLERDDERGIKVVEDFIQAKIDAKEPLSETHVKRLRGLRGKLGGITIKPLTLEGWYNGFVADEHAERAKAPPGRRQVGRGKAT